MSRKHKHSHTRVVDDDKSYDEKELEILRAAVDLVEK
jgi:hypothetical protein